MSTGESGTSTCLTHCCAFTPPHMYTPEPMDPQVFSYQQNKGNILVSHMGLVSVTFGPIPDSEKLNCGGLTGKHYITSGKW